MYIVDIKKVHEFQYLGIQGSDISTMKHARLFDKKNAAQNWCEPYLEWGWKGFVLAPMGR